MCKVVFLVNVSEERSFMSVPNFPCRPFLVFFKGPRISFGQMLSCWHVACCLWMGFFFFLVCVLQNGDAFQESMTKVSTMLLQICGPFVSIVHNKTRYTFLSVKTKYTYGNLIVVIIIIIMIYPVSPSCPNYVRYKNSVFPLWSILS